MIEIGLVGKPNVGKSTFFNALTMGNAPVANYPFTTIKANEGIGYVRVLDVGPEFGVKSNPRRGYIAGKWRFVPVKIIDVAGLVPGAHEGRGLGNQFLDDLRRAEVLIHVVDVSGKTDEEGRPTENYDPSQDIIWLEDEINYWIYGILEKNWRKIITKIKTTHVDPSLMLSEILSGLEIKLDDIKFVLKEFPSIDEWNNEILFNFVKKLRERAKPILIAANKIDLDRKNFKKLKEKFPNRIIIPTSAESELALKRAWEKGIIEYIPGEGDFKILKELEERQRRALEYIREKVLKVWGSTGVQNIVDKAVFDVLNYIAVFPGGVNKLMDKEGRILPDCFLLKKGSTALDFAYQIHSDLGKNFIRAIDVRTKKFLGKDYVLKHRDVIEIVAGR